MIGKCQVAQRQPPCIIELWPQLWDFTFWNVELYIDKYIKVRFEFIDALMMTVQNFR